MNAIVALLLLAIGMIVGFGLGLSGLIMGLATGWKNMGLAIALMTIGFSTGIGLLLYLIRINRTIQQNALRKALASVSDVLLRQLEHQGKPVIVTKEALFIDFHHYPYNTFYIKLTHADLLEEAGGYWLDMAFLVLANYSGHRPAFRIAVPPPQVEAARQAVAYIQTHYLGDKK